MDILFTETVYTSNPVLCIAFLILLIGASIYLGWSASEVNDDMPFIMSCIAILTSATFLVFSFITGGICEKEYVYVNQADVSVEEILEYEVVADLGDVIKLEKIK
jgi:hypothetical protein